MRAGFSIILCCYNSAGRLYETLGHIAALTIPEQLDAELLVIDNASTDDTAAIAKRLWKDNGTPFPLSILSQPRPGLSHARMLGIREAKYEYLLFCDDDNWLRQDYLTVATGILCAHPEVGMLGGFGAGVSDGPIPDWKHEIRIFGCGAQAAENGEAIILYGAGVILRKSIFNLLLKAGFSFLLPDREKERLSSGGDYELCYGVRMAGYKLWYDDRLYFRHFQPGDRFSLDYCKRFIRESSPALDILSIYRHFVYKPSRGIFSFYSDLIWDILHHVKRSAIYFRRYSTMPVSNDNRLPPFFNYTYHKFRIYYILCFLPSAGKHYKKIYHLKQSLVCNPGVKVWQPTPN